MSGTSQTPLREVAANDVTPESVDPAEIRAALDADSAPVRQRGARVCTTLAEDDTDSVRPVVDELGRALTDENPGVVQTAAAALTQAATADPAVVVETLDRAAALADADLGGVQIAGAQLLATVAKQEPAHCTPVVGTLLDRLGRPPASDDDESMAACVGDEITQRTIREHEEEEQQHERVARQVFANVVVAVAEAEPSALVDHVDTVADLTTAEDLVVRGAALDVLGAVGSESPSAVDPVADAILACLDADVGVLRARAVRTLGFLDDAQYADALSDVAATDPDDEVAAFAAETAAFLEE
ncbi:HEAT repeat domain-containing protein [Haloarcula marina]|uniref:HEAT repeat domain-containing protein n=1 Tax=Haloarcula marina TaxID=2961574 RepID=UPI0020B6DD0B|nr:HEAT repeat domain-containing protein [Halomicroarcula marina]